MQKYHGGSCHEICAQTVSLFITSYLRSESLISSATLDVAGEGAAHNTLRWLSQLMLALERWVKKMRVENLRCRDQKDFIGLGINNGFYFFFSSCRAGSQTQACLSGESRISSGFFFVCFSQLPHVQQSLCVVPIHWWVVLRRLALLHNDPVSLSRCEILTQHSMRNWRWGQCSLGYEPL